MTGGYAGQNQIGIPPLILIGMHRSGTSMLARMLEHLGLYIGQAKNNHHEAVFFFQINEWLLRINEGSWLTPEVIDRFLDDVPFRLLITNYVRLIMKSPRSIGYLGLFRYLRYRSPERLNIPWGWKDPRNTFTLPLWLDMFPEAKVVHIVRNGVDVANSITVRSQKQRAKKLAFYARPLMLRGASWVYPFQSEFYRSELSLEQGFALWEVYTCRADQHLARLPAHRKAEVRYEELLQHPEISLQTLCEFAGLEASPHMIAEAVTEVNLDRRNSYLSDDSLVSFYHAVKDSSQMVRYSYS